MKTVKRKALRGQTMTEYIVVVMFVAVVAVVGLSGTGSQPGLIDYVGDFYLRVVELVNLPLP